MSQAPNPAERIRELSEISQQTASIVEAAGLAISSLAGHDVGPNGPAGSAPMSVAERKAAFETHVESYYHNLQAVVARMRRQTYALEEAGIITAEAPLTATTRDQRQNSAPNAAQGRNGVPPQESNEPERITNGGLGSLDVGYLNSRGNKVGLEKEAELMEEAQQLLETIIANNG